MSRIALIPARGGSKRLPRKNILHINDKPLLAYPIKAALESSLFDSVLVSTDDLEIAEAAVQAGASVIERPDELATDRATVKDVCKHFLNTHPEADIFCCIYATAVRLRPDTLSRSFDKFRSFPHPDFIMGVSEYTHPPFQALVKGAEGYLSYKWPEWKDKQSQFYPRAVVSNGTFYWARRDAFLKEGTFYGEKLVGFLVPDEQVSDINTRDDFLRVNEQILSNFDS